ncbi:MAG TPA: hypothetical protein PLQ80_01925 [Candidatus Syntrophosphaera sp.]|nr:hypothetical protein [Candidatus Syntrophosphaera sp.]
MTFRTVSYKETMYLRYRYIDHSWRIVADDLTNLCLYPVDIVQDEFPIEGDVCDALVDGFAYDQILGTVCLEDAEIILREISKGCSNQDELLNWFGSFCSLICKEPGPSCDSDDVNNRMEFLKNQAEILWFSTLEWPDDVEDMCSQLCPDCARQALAEVGNQDK